MPEGPEVKIIQQELNLQLQENYILGSRNSKMKTCNFQSNMSFYLYKF